MEPEEARAGEPDADRGKGSQHRGAAARCQASKKLEPHLAPYVSLQTLASPFAKEKEILFLLIL